MEKALFATSAAIIFVLGCVHLYYTFFGRKLLPREAALMSRMAQVTPYISRQTTMWKGWVSFNASHSMGAILFGLIYGWLALEQTDLLFGTPFLLAVGLAMLGGYVVLAKEYWFSTPFVGVFISLVCFVSGVFLVR